MEQKTKDFLKKIKIDTYIYTFTFVLISVIYCLKHTVGAEASMLLLAAFAFYTIGRQVRLISDLEAGQVVDTKPRTPPWVRGITYLVIILVVLSVMFS